jgi:Kef-type K+ transport system membrane component KefB
LNGCIEVVKLKRRTFKQHMQFLDAINVYFPLLASTTETADSSMVLSAVLLSLVIIYLASKAGGELSNRVSLPPVLGELLGGVVVGICALHLLVFPEGSADGSHSLIMTFLQITAGLTPEATPAVFEAQSEVISVLAKLGVIILLFEIGLELNLKNLLSVGSQAAIVAVVGAIVPFTAGTVGLITIFGISTMRAVFAGAALTATSIGITSKVLSELGKLTSKEGQIILGAAVMDDVLGIIYLSANFLCDCWRKNKVRSVETSHPRQWRRFNYGHFPDSSDHYR